MSADRFPLDRAADSGAGVWQVSVRGIHPVPAASCGRLIYVTDGSAAVESIAGLWVLKRGRAAWLPANLIAHLVARTGAIVAALPLELPVDRQPGPVVVTALLRALVTRLVADADTGLAPTPDGPLHAVLADELNRLPGASDLTPTPADPRLRTLAARLLQSDGLRLTLAAAGREVGMSPRNLSRLVRRETGISFGRWRQKLHVSAAITPLSQGEPVSAVAYAIGYESPSAFISMFRRVTEMTPSEYVDHLRGVPPRPRRPSLRTSVATTLAAALPAALTDWGEWLAFVT
ncbi:MAG: hypothetical protein ABS36_01760 [Acidobacteria bacterium SCN 69-37]|nr:MAG: hypothetical protein ABS36_01760 [Acidobacteria bacterium SCN 69-37]